MKKVKNIDTNGDVNKKYTYEEYYEMGVKDARESTEDAQDNKDEEKTE